MKNPYLLMAGYNYYPSGGTDDWIGCYPSYDEAYQQLHVKNFYTYYSKGNKKGEIKSTINKFIINGQEFDWFQIVDLQVWANK